MCTSKTYTRFSSQYFNFVFSDRIYLLYFLSRKINPRKADTALKYCIFSLNYILS